MLKKLVNYR
jgi:hypothetical protein